MIWYNVYTLMITEGKPPRAADVDVCLFYPAWLPNATTNTAQLTTTTNTGV